MLDEYKTLIYLGSPYSHPDAAVRQQRFEAVCLATGKLIAQGHHVLSPIAHSHPVSTLSTKNGITIPGDWKFWKPYDANIILRCDVFAVLMLPGWRESTGLNAEIEIALEHGLSVVYVCADTLQFYSDPEKKFDVQI